MSEHDAGSPQPGGLTLLSAGLNLAELDLHGGDGLWAEVKRYVRASQLEAQVDAAMGGRAAPRIWAFIEAPGTGASAAAAALGAAWLLAERGQMVVLVDADEQDPRITRWVGRVEQEGWIDMVRFGASLHAASASLPAEGRHGSVLGVGSFAPTGVTADEVAELLGRLRRQADDLILVLPAKLRSVPWLEAAHIRLLCWDLLARGAADTEKIIDELDRMGARPDALLGFGVEEVRLIQARLHEAPPPPAPPPPAEPAVAAHVAAAAAPDPFLTTRAAEEEPPVEPGPARRRTSPVFVVVAVVVVVSLALLGLFLRNQGSLDRPADEVAVVRLMPPREAVPAGSQAPPLPEDAAAEQPAVERPAAEQPAVETDAVPPPPVAEPEPAGAGEPTVREDVPDQPPPPTTGAAVFDRTPYEKPAGQDGWTLWLFSLPDETTAASEVRRLERLGLQAAQRAVELPDRGRWFRVYTGSFATRAEAGAAAPALKAHLKHDWAQAARF